MNQLLAILDIAKTTARLVVVDAATGQTVSLARRGATAGAPGPLRQLEVATLQDWLLDSLAACPERGRIGAIVPMTHGAACVMVDGAGETVLAPDYEDPVFEQDAEAYAGARDRFDATFSPLLPLGLNLGRQIFFVQRRLPEFFARVTRILLYPQYWAWWLCGVAASEVTSLGCHTDLWWPREAGFSWLARRQGWHRLLADLRPASDRLGPIRPDLAARCGLDPACQVLCGLHDSSASYLRHRAQRPTGAPFSVVSSGTWTVILSNRTPLSALRQERDMLANIDAQGSVVGTARFMGGREYEAVAGREPAVPDQAALTRVLAGPALAQPAFSVGGQFAGRAGSVTGAEALDPPARAALATLYVALLTDVALDLLGPTGGDLALDGPLAANPLYPALLAALRPNSTLLLGERDEGTIGGALSLTLGAAARLPALRTVAPPPPMPGLAQHAQRWRTTVLART